MTWIERAAEKILLADDEEKYDKEFKKEVADIIRTALAEHAPVVTLCGSSRFVDFMAVCGWLLEREENVIAMGLHLLPFWYEAKADHLAEHEGVAEQMDALHLKKIEMSKEIFVVNRNGYIGDSTRNEIEHATKLSIPIRWYTHDPIGEMAEEIAQKWLMKNPASEKR